jgi:hypothetical protein
MSVRNIGPTDGELLRLHEDNCLYVTTYPGSDVYYAATERLLPERHWISGWTILGQELGHEWCRCDQCYVYKLMAPRKMKCAMTPGCEGNYERLFPRPRMTKKIKAMIYE